MSQTKQVCKFLFVCFREKIVLNQRRQFYKVQTFNDFILSKLYISLDASLPPSILCSRRDCGHEKVLGKHFESDSWATWISANDTVSGKVNVFMMMWVMSILF